ncbi:MAG: hypothetical protein AXA67_10265 [Methylothermaceae bacteria B42]|nr:MAG: hypothetical protein AXA67_10265 [Methylothermaceae bacteria B42]HHJ40546.1 hypothetical protein [Methylothermaceae bacterium]
MNGLRRHLLTTFLAGLCLLLATAVLVEYIFLRRSTPHLEAPEANPKTEISLNPKAPPPAKPLPLEQFQSMVTMPLFVEGRQPIPEQDKTGETSTQASGPPPKIELTGIIQTPDAGKIILVRDKKGKTRRLRPGDDVDGWQLAELAPDHVVLTQGAKKHTLKLIKPRPQSKIRRPRRHQRPTLPKNRVNKPITNPFAPLKPAPTQPK